MREIKLGSWTIKILSSEYILWSNENQIMVEFDSEKIATISLNPNGEILISSINSVCEIDKEKELISVVSTEDPNITFN